MTVKLIIGWLYAVVLCLIYAVFLYAYGYVREWQHSHGPWFELLVFLFPVSFAIFIGCCYGVFQFCRRHHLDSRGYWRFAFLVILTIPIAYLMHDASPIEHDYSMTDIVPGDPRILESYDTLMSFRKGASIKLDTSFDYSTLTNSFANRLANIMAHSESISRDWDRMAEARSVIDKLDTYPGIADLTAPIKMDMNASFLAYSTLQYGIGRIYGTYAILKTAEGHSEEAARHLAKLHSVTRKALPYSTLLVNKMTWIRMASDNIETAFAITQLPQCNHDTLEILKEAFSPIPEEDVSLRRVLIGEYLEIKSTICEIKGKPSQIKGAKTAAYFLVQQITFNKNRIIRDLHKHRELLIEGANQHPPDTSRADRFMNDYCRHPVINDLYGWAIVSHAVPSFKRPFEAAVKTKILSDLLAIEIGNRLGQPVVLNDYYSDGPYGRDERTGRAYSVGPDKKPNTDDDIVLGKQQDD